MFGKDSKKKELIAKLGTIYQTIQREHNISAGDFPNLEKMQLQLEVSCVLKSYWVSFAFDSHLKGSRRE